MGFAPSWLRQVSPSASRDHFSHCWPPFLRQIFATDEGDDSNRLQRKWWIIIINQLLLCSNFCQGLHIRVHRVSQRNDKILNCP